MSTDTTTVVLGAITRDDIAALRMADSVSFHHRPVTGGFIRAHLDGYGGRILSARQQRLFPPSDVREDGGRSREIRVETSMYGHEGDGGSWTSANSPRATAFAMIHGAGYDRFWQTIASLLRPGEVLSLAWVADNNNGYIRDAGLHCDEVHLVVEGPARTLYFRLDRSVCVDNTARMVKRYGV